MATEECNPPTATVSFTINGNPDVVNIKSISSGAVNMGGDQADCDVPNSATSGSEYVSVAVAIPNEASMPSGTGGSSFGVSDVLYNYQFTSFPTGSCNLTFGDASGNLVTFPISVSIGS